MYKYAELTSQGAAAYLNALESIGWFGLPQNDRAKMEEHLSGIDDNNYFFFALAHITEDAEGYDSGDAYKQFFTKVAAISGLEIVSAEFEYNAIDIGEDELTGTVVTKNDTYDCELEELMGWLDGDFVDYFINEEVLPGENIYGRFFMLPATDQMVQYTFIPEDMYEKAIEAGILPDDPEYFMSEFDDED